MHSNLPSRLRRISRNMANLLPDYIPFGVHLSLMQAYNAHFGQWQAYANSLRDRIQVLEKDNEELRDCRDILQRMVDVQRELMLEADQANAERQCSPGGYQSNCLSSPSTLSPMLDVAEMNSCPAGAFSIAEPVHDPCTRSNDPTGTDVGGPLKLRRESTGVADS
jgi:hypothetical protein